MQKEKLYSPLKFYISDDDSRRGEITHKEVFGDIDLIEVAVRRNLLGGKSGLAESIPDSLDGVIVSMFPNIEFHSDRLWYVADVNLSRAITPGEMGELSQWWEGQLSEGWGKRIRQIEVEVDRGSLYIEPWTSDDDFHIYTQNEFDEYMSITSEQMETPAQAALHEPDIYGDEATAALREQLISQLDGNLSVYFKDISDKDELNIPGMSSEIAAVMGAHHYLTEKHNFHKSELEYLLQFKNPLEVVADKFDVAGIDDYSDVMWDIFDRQEALQGDYERVMPGGEAQEEALSDRLDENFADFKKGYMEMGKADIFVNADEIAAVTQAYQYFREDHNYTPEQVDHLLRFENPLEVVSDRWAGSLRDISPIVNDIFNERNRESALLCYTLADPLAGHEPTCGETDGKPSVLAQIRRAREDARENPAPRNSTPGKDHEPEL